jgi:hypothetical protein
MMRIAIVACLALGTVVASHPALLAQTPSPGKVTVYARVADVQAKDAGRGPAASIPLKVDGSQELKVAFVARGTGGVQRASLNIFDAKAQDNTTALSYAWVDEAWRPILYRCDRFRYNGGSMDSIVRADTAYDGIRFFGAPTPGQQGVLHLRNLVVYRGEDTEAPAAPAAPSASTTPGGVRLAWREPADNVGVARYSISRASADGRFEKIAETSELEFVDATAPAGASSYRVLAIDFQDNLSPWSAAVSATATAPAAAATAPSPYEQDRRAYAAEVRRIHDSGVGRVVRGRVLQFGDSLSGATLYRLEAEAALGRYMVEARGRAGWTTGQGKDVIEQDLRELRPEFCLILYGTNNVKAGSNRGAMNDLQFMTSACAAAGAVPVVGTIPPRGFQDRDSKPEAKYNEELVKTFRAAHIPIGYMFELLQPIEDRHTYLAGDGIHWDKQAFRLSAGVWRDVITQVQFALLDRP